MNKTHVFICLSIVTTVKCIPMSLLESFALFYVVFKLSVGLLAVRGTC